jgi:KipI family sensor histidine kinase inhibitor
MNTHFVGDSALLIDTQDARAAQQLRVAILRRPLNGLSELVPAYNTLLVQFDPLEFDIKSFIRRLPEFVRTPVPLALPREHDIPVAYGGEDLEEIARITNLDIAEVIQCHSSATYTVAFLGFAPGFPYLVGLDPRLRVARLKSPRIKVPAGAVAIAGEFSGIYPQATPGGWRILGHTEAVLFDPEQVPPARFIPGDKIHFHPLA